MVTDKEKLIIEAIEVLYNSSKAFAMDDNNYVPCNMCISHDGKLILGCSRQEPAHGVLVVIKGKTYDLRVIGDSKPVNSNELYHKRYKKYFPCESNISMLVEITPIDYVIVDKDNNEIKIDGLNLKNKFSGEIEERMTEHMNDDHVEAMKDYCHYAEIKVGEQDPYMLGVDPYGFDMMVNNQLQRFQFNKKCDTPVEVREALVELAKKSRSKLEVLTTLSN